MIVCIVGQQAELFKVKLFLLIAQEVEEIDLGQDNFLNL